VLDSPSGEVIRKTTTESSYYLLPHALLGSAVQDLAAQDGSLVPALAPEYGAKILCILDGDTLEVLYAQATHDQIMVQ
jgi:endonuclease YncB( thermonuclease family)